MLGFDRPNLDPNRRRDAIWRLIERLPVAQRSQLVENLRIEQLYPFPEEDLAEIIAPYKNLKKVIWCQEEPMNQGAWYCSQHHMRRVASAHQKGLFLEYAGREASASPACGYPSMHAEQQEKLLHDAFNI